MMSSEMEFLNGRVRDLNAENAEMRRQVDALTRERDALRTALQFADLRINRMLGHTPRMLPRLFRGQA